MTFENFVKLYKEDMKHQLREHIFIKKQSLIDDKLLPFLESYPYSKQYLPIFASSKIKLLSYRDSDGKGYSETYLWDIHNQLSTILDYAIQYYDLKENPCKKAGCMEKTMHKKCRFGQ